MVLFDVLFIINLPENFLLGKKGRREEGRRRATWKETRSQRKCEKTGVRGGGREPKSVIPKKRGDSVLECLPG